MAMTGVTVTPMDFRSNDRRSGWTGVARVSATTLLPASNMTGVVPRRWTMTGVTVAPP
jgi:hypothetical protein